MRRTASANKNKNNVVLEIPLKKLTAKGQLANGVEFQLKPAEGAESTSTAKNITPKVEASHNACKRLLIKLAQSKRHCCRAVCRIKMEAGSLLI